MQATTTKNHRRELRRRVVKSYSVPRYVVEALDRESRETDVPRSRILERAVVRHLKLKRVEP